MENVWHGVRGRDRDKEDPGMSREVILPYLVGIGDQPFERALPRQSRYLIVWRPECRS